MYSGNEVSDTAQLGNSLYIEIQSSPHFYHSMFWKCDIESSHIPVIRWNYQGVAWLLENKWTIQAPCKEHLGVTKYA